MDYEDEMLIGMSYEQFLAGLSDDDLDYKINCVQAQINGVPNQGCATLTSPEQTLDSLLDERERRSGGLVSSLTNNKVMLLGLGLLAYYLYTKRK
tara:strand:- start:417 stop:701 length:285 start_codon:yes stop_codon:yes gene_type:complete